MEFYAQLADRQDAVRGRLSARRAKGVFMTKAVLGIIGGSGIYDLPGLTNAQSKTVSSP
jgi:purine nucleoside phosphorylase